MTKGNDERHKDKKPPNERETPEIPETAAPDGRGHTPGSEAPDPRRPREDDDDSRSASG